MEEDQEAREEATPPCCPSVIWSDEAEFERWSRAHPARAGRDRHVLDVTPATIRNYAQGSFDLILRDLATLGPRALSDLGLDADGDNSGGTLRPVKEAFRIRRNLVSLKKVWFHVSRLASDVEDDLTRGCTWNFRNLSSGDGDRFSHSSEYRELAQALNCCRGSLGGIIDGRGLTKGLACMPRFPESSRDDPEDPRGPASPNSEARERETLPRILSDLPRSLPSYKILAQAQAFLRRSSLGGSDTADVHVEAEAGAGAGTGAGADAEEAEGRSTTEVGTEGGGRRPCGDRNSCPAASHSSVLTTILERVASEAGWQRHALRFLRLSIIARGGAKALAIAAELPRAHQALLAFEQDIDETLGLLDRLLGHLDAPQPTLSTRSAAAANAAEGAAEEDHADNADNTDNADHGLAERNPVLHPSGSEEPHRPEAPLPPHPFEPENPSTGFLGPLHDPSLLSFETRMHGDKHRRSLAALKEAVQDLARSLEVIDSEGGRTQPLFVAADCGSTTSALVVPKGFRVAGETLRHCRQVAGRFRSKFRKDVETLGWPPHPLGGTGTAVATAEAGGAMVGSKVGAGAVCVLGPHTCARCGVGFKKIWLVRGTSVCIQCDTRLRDGGPGGSSGGTGGSEGSDASSTSASPGRSSAQDFPDQNNSTGICPRRTKSCFKAAWCPHLRRCFACELHSCDLCGLRTGDGATAMALAESLDAKVVFVDFDRTLASTRRGQSPFPTKRGTAAAATAAATTMRMNTTSGTALMVSGNPGKPGEGDSWGKFHKQLIYV